MSHSADTYDMHLNTLKLSSASQSKVSQQYGKVNQALKLSTDVSIGTDVSSIAFYPHDDLCKLKLLVLHQ
eukprot:6716279-Ditylum_brightwellii.AAC.1